MCLQPVFMSHLPCASTSQQQFYTPTSVAHLSPEVFMPHNPPPVYLNMDQQKDNQQLRNVSPRESFLGTLLSSTPKAPFENMEESSPFSNRREQSPQEMSSSSANQIIDPGSPLSEYREPIENTVTPWQPCDSCKEEVRKLMEENKRMEAILLSISLDQVKAVRGLCDGVEQYFKAASTETPASRMGQQELFPGCSLYISSFRLAAVHQAAQKDCLRLFHLLFEVFFTDEECANSVVFGRHGKCPEGKNKLDQAKVNAILTYVMRFAGVEGWKAVELAKLKKALINKCRHRAEKFSH
ncbi:hypothetical protein UPYG_G00355280 [Umbra pygmaea]|uniref:BEN domain-containing protein n=1 Tax=Umbra pygmaea TaxID=75934 RepID=A0ABD0VZ64_UMBPY